MRHSIRIAIALGVLPALASADVQPVGPEFRVNSYTTGTQYMYRVGACGNPTGDFLVVWASVGQDGAGLGVFAQRHRDGAPLGTEFRVNTYTTGKQGGPTTACRPDGSSFAIWADSARDGSGLGSTRSASPATARPSGRSSR